MKRHKLRNRMISAIEMSGDRLVNIVVSYGTMFGKPVRETSASLIDVELMHLLQDMQ